MTADMTVWATPAWREEAVAWLDARLAETGARRTGEVEQPHLRPWATALRAPTTRGVVWLKAAGPGTAFEVGLYDVLRAVVPDQLLTPIATDVQRGWVLLEDGGVPIGQRLDAEELVDAMVAVLPQYAELQRALAPRVDDLLRVGVADMRPATLPGRFDEALAVVGAYADRQADPGPREQVTRLAALAPRVAAWSERLARAPGGASLDHNDLHPYNVFLADGRARFYDWGDAVVAHPFASMLVVLGYMRELVLDSDAGDPRLLRLRDAYLEAFSDVAPHAELVQTMELARYLAQVPRTLIWHRAIQTMDPAEVPAEWADAPLETLGWMLEGQPEED